MGKGEITKSSECPITVRNLEIEVLYQLTQYVVDVLWGQPIKLIQVVSTSEFHEY